MMQIQFIRTHHRAQCPSKTFESDAWFDFYSIEDYILQPWERKLFKTGIKHILPEGYYGRIAGRSGLSYHHGIDVLGGVIDSNYRWEIGVILLNTSKEDVIIKTWDWIAQYIIEKHYQATRIEVDNLEDSDRKECGFWWINTI